MSNLIFPVLSFWENDKLLYAHSKEKDFYTADYKFTKEGKFNGIYFIDSTGKQYLVKSAAMIKWATPFWGYSLMIKGRQIKVDFDMELLGLITLADLKAFAVERISFNKDHYEEYAGGPEYFLKAIENAQTYSEVIQLFF